MDASIAAWIGPGLRYLDAKEVKFLSTRGFDPCALMTPYQLKKALQIDGETLRTLALTHGLPRFIAFGYVRFHPEIARLWLRCNPEAWSLVCAQRMAYLNEPLVGPRATSTGE